MSNESISPPRPALDVAANRRAQKYSGCELAARLAWRAAEPFFRWSPRPFYAWRAWLLRRFGAQIGRKVHIYPTVRIQHPWLLKVGDFAAVGDSADLQPRPGENRRSSYRIAICPPFAGGHDPRSPDMRLLKEPIVIGDDAWVCADAFVGPGVTIGDGAVAGARAAIFKDVDPWTVVGGNPAEFIKRREIRDSPPTSPRLDAQ